MCVLWKKIHLAFPLSSFTVELLAQNLYIPPEVQKKHTGRPMIHARKTCTMNPTQPARKTPTEKRTDRNSSTTQKLVAHDTMGFWTILLPSW